MGDEWEDGDDSELYDTGYQDGYKRGLLDLLKVRNDIDKIEWLLENNNLKGKVTQ
jgi:hypothetical protein